MSNLKNGRFLGIGKRSRFFVVCLIQTSAKTFFFQTPGRPTPHITDRGVNTVTVGWVGDLNQRIPLRIHDGGIIDFCRSMSAEGSHTSWLSMPIGMTPVPARKGVLYALLGAQLKSA